MDDDGQTIEATAIDPIDLTADIVSAYVANNSVPVSELPALLASTHAALAELGASAASAASAVERLTPVQIRKSINHEALISFEDGKPYKTLKRHLTGLGLTPEAYRTKWGLPTDYPIVAPGYSKARSKLAHALGLGRKRAEAEPAPEAILAAAAPAEKPKRAGRPRKAEEPTEA